MEWIEGIRKTIYYMEEHITEELSVEEIAKQAFLSPYYFQKGFAFLCGYTVGEYIRRRRLSLAGSELMSTNSKMIDIALKYGYDSPDSFSKAFTRFHGVTPTAVRKEGAMIKSFAPLKIKFSLEGGYQMDYKIVKKEAFTVVGIATKFRYDHAEVEVPKFWKENYQMVEHKKVCGTYGINMDESMECNEFEYLIADNYNPIEEVPAGCITKVIPSYTWAVFACKGAMPETIQEVNRTIFSEWLPNEKEYEIAAGYNIEMYNNPEDYPKGIQDENYYAEVWIPVKKK